MYNYAMLKYNEKIPRKPRNYVIYKGLKGEEFGWDNEI